MPVGAIVAAFDPQGVMCGQFTVTHVAWYGLMPCYGDDSTTPQDEGAVVGDPLRFTVNGREYLVAETTAKVGIGLIDAGQADFSKWLGVDVGN